MIKSNKDQVILEFGQGDIGVETHFGEPTGVVTFYTPSHAGCVGKKIDFAMQRTIEGCPIVMKFHTTKSIDVLIAALKLAKQSMNTDDLVKFG